jgi:hypothetical protein
MVRQGLLAHYQSLFDRFLCDRIRHFCHQLGEVVRVGRATRACPHIVLGVLDPGSTSFRGAATATDKQTSDRLFE